MASKGTSRESVKVAVRLRPMSNTERDAGYDHIVRIDSTDAVVNVKNATGQTVSFRYDFAFPEGISQEEIYEKTSAPIVSGVLEGFNGTIFAYGQTGTGKTYSMDGKDGDHRGITPRAFEHIFDYLAANQDSHQFFLSVTYVEIYNDKLRDLLATTVNDGLRIREDPEHGVQIHGVEVKKVEKIEDIWKLLKIGKKNRKTSSTQMNSESSRSHAILTLVVETLTRIEGGQHIRKARLNLVDLAGSERVAKTGASGEVFKEGVNINYELMILGDCISALTSRGHSHIPYRDSKLTMLLKDSLGGNARTMMIAALGPASYNYCETISTLRYAERAKKIENKPKVNMDPKDAEILRLQNELAALQALLEGGGGGSVSGGISGVSGGLGSTFSSIPVADGECSNSPVFDAESASLSQALSAKQAAVKEEQARREALQQRFRELSKWFQGDLATRTRANEEELAAARAKLRQREERARELAEEVAARNERRQIAIDKCASINAQVEAVSKQFSDSVRQYRNLKVKLPELQKTIQVDREALSQNIEFLNRRIELYNIIVDNYIPESYVHRIRTQSTFDEETFRWSPPVICERSIQDRIFDTVRPKSALGFNFPTSTERETGTGTGTGPITGPAGNVTHQSPNVEMRVIDLGIPSIPSRLKPGPVKIRTRNIEEVIAAAFKDPGPEIVVDIPDGRPEVRPRKCLIPVHP
jgi:kinesin family protein 3/17